jgi:hypothetical protein
LPWLFETLGHHQVLVGCIAHFLAVVTHAMLPSHQALIFVRHLMRRMNRSKRSYRRPRCRRHMRYYHRLCMCDFFGNTPVITRDCYVPVYMLHADSGTILLEPCRMPLGPKRAPGRAVTPCLSQNMSYRKVSFPSW